MVVSLYSCHWISSSSLISGLTAVGGGSCWAETGGVAVRAEGREPGGGRGRLVRWTRGLSLTGRRRAMGLGRTWAAWAAVGAGEAIVGCVCVCVCVEVERDDDAVDVFAVGSSAASPPYVSAAAPTWTSQFATARQQSLQENRTRRNQRNRRNPPFTPPLASKQTALYRIFRSSHITMKPLFSAYVCPPPPRWCSLTRSPPTVKPPANVIGARQIHRLVMVILASRSGG